jgi:hypothetical protein
MVYTNHVIHKTTVWPMPKMPPLSALAIAKCCAQKCPSKRAPANKRHNRNVTKPNNLSIKPFRITENHTTKGLFRITFFLKQMKI